MKGEVSLETFGQDILTYYLLKVLCILYVRDNPVLLDFSTLPTKKQ